ncbi:MAG: FTR1 family iron permease [Terriglobales bacterium]
MTAPAPTLTRAAHPAPAPKRRHRGWLWGALGVVGGLIVLRALSGGGGPSPAATAGGVSAVLEIGVLVFREGLECILILAAITGGLRQAGNDFRRPIFSGAVGGLALTVVTWVIAVRILTDLGQNISALNLQAATGLLAVIVLLIVMNWFFHKLYWTGWISLHNRRKRELMEREPEPGGSGAAWWWGLAALGFSSVYREGVEVVLFLQSYRLRLGNGPVAYGVSIGLVLTVVVGLLTLLAHRRLPYRRMLVFTGVLLGVVFLVMVGEQVQEMQLAHWLPASQLPWLAHLIPSWAGLWFSLFPNLESLLAQAVAAAFVLGSYFVARQRGTAASAAA